MSFPGTGNAELALQEIKEGISALRDVKDSLQTAEKLDLQHPNIKPIMSIYRDVLERDGWLLLGHSLLKLGRNRDAEVAYLEVLKKEPEDWRAYAGLLGASLKADEETFNSILEKAQKDLRMEGWTDFPPFGYPDKFFSEKELLRKRSRLKY